MNEHNDPRCLKWGEGRAPRKARIWRVYHAVKRLGEMSELSTTEWGSTNLVHPAISQVIFIGQLQPIGPDSCIEPGSSAIPDAHTRAFPLRIRESIHDGLLIDGQPKHIHMSVLPSHHSYWLDSPFRPSFCSGSFHLFSFQAARIE